MLPQFARALPQRPWPMMSQCFLSLQKQLPPFPGGPGRVLLRGWGWGPCRHPPPAPPRGQALPQSRARACTPLPTVGSGLGRDAPLPARLRLPKAGPPPNKGRDTPQGPRPPGPAPGPSTSPAAAGGGRQGALPVPGARDPFLSGAGRRSARRFRASAAVGGRAAPSGAGPGPGGGGRRWRGGEGGPFSVGSKP